MNTAPIQLVSITPVGDDSFPPGLLRAQYRSGVDGLDDWALVLPPTHGDTWIVNLHGHGSTGDQLYTREDIKRDWLTAFGDRGLGILTPNLRGDAWMSPAAATDLHALLALVRSDFGAITSPPHCGGSMTLRPSSPRPPAMQGASNGNTSGATECRFIFVGGSMGGTGNLIYAILHPHDVAAVVALCPAADIATLHGYCAARADVRFLADAICAAYGGTPDDVPDVYARHSALRHCDRLTMPVFIAHAEGDTSIPVTESRALAAAFEGDLLMYHEIPGGHHDSPLATDIMTEALNWVLAPQGD